MCQMGIHIPHGKGQFSGKRAPIVKYRDFLQWAVQKRLKRSRCHLGYGLSQLGGPNEACIRWGHIPHVKGQLLGGKDMPDDILPWAVPKWLNQSICHLGCGVCTWMGQRKRKFSRIHQVAPMGGHIGTTWWIWFNFSSMAAMRPLCQITLTTCFLTYLVLLE